ncbi:hypothetical protein HUJ04_001435 [Dendroctonus ponderosae]|nr:hypothetical protein HUJ04_001435 [Dendroctonus ponderosae]
MTSYKPRQLIFPLLKQKSFLKHTLILFQSMSQVVQDGLTENKDSSIKTSTPPPKGTMTNGTKTQDDPLPQCSCMHDSSNAPIKTPGSSSFQLLSPEVIMPIPKVKTAVKRVQRKRGKTAILTSPPYQNELTEAMENKRGWISSLEGKKWAHNASGIDSDDDESVLVCEFCKSENNRFPILPRGPT